jgi:hypothetical protein
MQLFSPHPLFLQGMRINDKHNASLEGTLDKCSEIQSLRLSSEDLASQGSQLLAQGSKTLEEAKTFFSKLDGTFDNMKKTGLLLVTNAPFCSPTYLVPHLQPNQTNIFKQIFYSHILDDFLTLIFQF